ncbi:MAG: glutathione peroxidase [Gemmataceae bacterium]|nr:glutathione peroxidase [Gemmataceae bacterium]MCI0739007.1 glutathione peroxidase [Gemmataceae bacterium]
MRRCWIVALGFVFLPTAVLTQEKGSKAVPAVLKFQMKDIDGKTVDLAKYQGKVILFVNVASECGYTDQYKPLQALHAKYAKDGLAILGIPCNDFGGQEPGTEKQIKEFCSTKYNVTFDLFAKVGITKDPAPLYRFLISKETNPKFAGPVRWNFEKFLVGRDGTVVARFASDVDPEGDAFVQAIRKELEKK